MFLRILLACVVLVYAPSLGHQFNVDDLAYLRGELTSSFPALSDFFTKTADQHYAPLNFLLNVWLFHVFPPDPLPFRLLNIALFLLNVYLLYALVLLLSEDRELAFISALLFSFHPLNVMIVNRISFNIILICMALAQGSLLCLGMAARRARPRPLYTGSFVCFALALLCQEIAILLPFYAGAMLFYAFRFSFRKTVAYIWPHVLCGGMFLAIWMAFGGQSSHLLEKARILGISFPSFVATIWTLLSWYVTLFFFPVGIVFIHNVDPVTASAWITVKILLFILAAEGCYVLFKQWGRDLRGMALAWVLSGFLIVLPASFVHANMGLVIEPYWFYIPSMGLFILAAYAVRFIFLKVPRGIFWVFFMLVVSGLLILDYQYHLVCRTTRSYAEHWLKYSPRNHVALLVLANLESEEGNYTAARSLTRKILATAKYPVPHIYAYMATHALVNNDLVNARRYVDLTLHDIPESVWAWNSLGIIEMKERHFPAAAAAFQKVLAISPRFPYASLNLAGVYFQQKRYADGLRLLQGLRTLSLPSDFQNDLAVAETAYFLLTGSPERARSRLTELLQRNPPDEILVSLSRYLDDIDETDTAIHVLQEQLPRYPQKAKLYLELGDLLSKNGDPESATRVWQSGLKIVPGDRKLSDRLSQSAATPRPEE